MSGLTPVVWDAHGIGFSLPSDSEIEKNSINEFEGGNEDCQMHISVWEDGDVDEDDLETGLRECAEQIGFDEIEEAGDLEIDDFVGCGAFGYKNGIPAAVVLLLDKESETNFVCTVVCPSGDTSVAEAIIGSFYAYDGPDDDGDDGEDEAYDDDEAYEGGEDEEYEGNDYDEDDDDEDDEYDDEYDEE